MVDSSLLKNVSAGKFAFLEFIMLLPTGICSLLLWYYGFLLITLVIYMFLCLLIMPGLYIFIFKLKSEVANLAFSLANMYLGISKQLTYGAAGFLISGLLMSGTLFVTLQYLHFWHMDHVNMLWYPDTEIVTLSILMILLLPFLEELFWRGFMQVFLVGGLTYDHPTELVCWWIAAHYGFTYIFVFANFTVHLWQAILCAIPFVFLGRKFTLWRHYGVLTVIIAHTGLNLGFVIILNLWYWNKWPINSYVYQGQTH